MKDDNILDLVERPKGLSKWNKFIGAVFSLLVWLWLGIFTYDVKMPVDGSNKFGFPLFFYEEWDDHRIEDVNSSIDWVGVLSNIAFIILLYTVILLLIRRIRRI